MNGQFKQGRGCNIMRKHVGIELTTSEWGGVWKVHYLYSTHIFVVLYSLQGCTISL